MGKASHDSHIVTKMHDIGHIFGHVTKSQSQHMRR